MADDWDDQQGGDDFDAEDIEVGEGRKGGKRLIFLVILPLLLVIGAAAGAYFTGAADPLIAMIFGTGEEVAAEPDPADENIERRERAKTGTFYELPELLVNLNTSGRQSQFLKIRVTLELDNPDDQGKVESALPRIMDNFQIYLRELRTEDLRGSAGIYRLREELLARVNATTAPARINDVLFREMLIQ